ncbi:MAG: S9 family peptidase [Acidobacteria bacterium]|nr:S9 family peptidase [Acidobacteriota bacterium]
MNAARTATSVLLLMVFLCSLLAQDEYVTPGENLVTEGIPKVPAAMAAELDRYSDFRDAGFLSWHPVRREMVIATRFADTPQLHLVKFPGGDRTQLTFFKDGVEEASYQPTLGNYLVFSKDTGGNENFQKYRYDFATGAITIITDGSSRNTGGVWSHDGKRYEYESTRRNGEDADLHVIDPERPSSDRMIAQGKGDSWSAFEFSPDDKLLIVSESISVNESYLWLVDSSTGVKKLITPKSDGESAAYTQARFSKDARGVFAITDRGSEFQRLVYIDLASGKQTVLTPPINSDVEFFALSFDGRNIAYVTNEDGLSVLYLYDTALHKQLPAPTLPPGVVNSLEWHRNNHDLAFDMSTAQAPNDVYSLDVRTGKIDRWTTSETAGLNTQSFSVPSVVHWKSFDGRMISGLYYKPPAKFSGKRPVLINIHGGPESQSRPWFQGEGNYFINEMGIAVIQPNVRGSTGYGKTFVTLDNGFLREDSYKDIGSLLDWIRTQPDLDSSRVMVNGGSYGGNATLAVSTMYADRIRCALDAFGPSNFVTFLENTSAYRRDLRRVEYGDERDPKMREFLNRIAPMNNAAKIVKPLFVVAGGNDPRVPLTESQQIVQAVRKNGIPVWYLMAKDEGHGFAKKQNRDFQLYTAVLFMNEYLLK